MQEISPSSSRRTAADDVFSRLHADIIDLRLAPGTKLSEVDVARKFDVSRQPVREAFIRLAELELLHVRPQRATEVKRISETSVLNARFVRLAVELEIIRRACARKSCAFNRRFAANLEQQEKAIDADRTERFHTLDYEFHKLLSRAAGCEFAFVTVGRTKAQVNRLCRLSLTDPSELRETLEDHRGLYAHVRDGEVEPAMALMRLHLSRIDNILPRVRESHPEYFEAN